MKQKIKSITAQEFISANFPDYGAIPENAFTLDDVMKSTGLKLSACNMKVKKLLDDGSLQKIKRLRNGSMKTFFVPK